VIRVEVACADGPHRVRRRSVELPAGATAADALRACGLLDELGSAALEGLALGVWGRVCAPTAVLRDGDRLELLRPLRVDPKDARRLRYERDGLTRRARPPRR
jgi:putative ubiquitin-RnfH superfamily antitoxin RatB of RatAB toxin-antitoxin module